MWRPLRWTLIGFLIGLLLLAGLTPPALAQGCGDAPVPRLSVGGQGRVAFSDGQPLNVRNAASVSANRTGSLPEGTVFTVQEGPVCADGIHWWRIQAADLTGWVAEGQASSYFVEPRSGEDDPPLLMSAYTGDGFNHQELYRYTGGAWEAVTEGGYKNGFALSPWGDRVVYRTAPPIMQEAVERGWGYLYGTAWDIAVVDLETGATHTLTRQPENVTLTDSDQLRNGIDRALPVWSPDGTAIAWTEIDYLPGDAARLVVCDLTTNSIRVLDDALPFMNMSEDGQPVFFTWGEPGIAVFTNDPTDFAETARLYDPVEGLQRVVRLDYETLERGWNPWTGPVWVTDGDQDTLVIQADEYIWLAVEPAEGSVRGWNYRLVWASATGTDPSLQAVWDLYAYPDQPVWQLLEPAGEVIETRQEAPELNRFTIAPSGQAAAYWQEDGTLVMWQAGETTVLAVPEGLRPQSLLWGALHWQAGEFYDSVG